jgi:hypothetical protein
MARLIFYYLLLFGSCGYALARGKAEARIVAGAFFVGNFATIAMHSHLRGGYSSLETGVFIVDVACFLIFTYAALISDRFWPLWVSGLQLTTNFGHVFKAIDPNLLPLAYAAALRFWGYPILIILVVGTWRQHRRLLKEEAKDALPC